MDTWHNNKDSSCLHQHSCLKRILRIQWPNTIRNKDLWEQTGSSLIGLEIKKRRWNWIGHTLRKPPNNVTRQALRWNPQGKRKKGRPRNTWRRDLEADMTGSGLSWGLIKRLAEDRVGWRELVCGLCSPRSAVKANDDDMALLLLRVHLN